MIRILDVIFSLVGLVVGAPLLLVLILLGWFDTRSPLFLQTRVGQFQKPFVLIKFRTMKTSTNSIATHLVNADAITSLGRFMRRTKLDELPQLWNVLKGEMSLVGPRPCLYSQSELIDEREVRGIYEVRPGITGLAQINEIDMSTPRLLAQTDEDMLNSMGLKKYFVYIFYTIAGKGAGDRVT